MCILEINEMLAPDFIPVPNACAFIPVSRKWQPTPVFLPGKSHGQRSLAGYSTRGRKESDTTKRLHFTSLQAQGGEGDDRG